MFRPPRETPTDWEPSFSAPRPRAGGPVESAAAWLRAFVSSRDLFCLATENRTQDTGHAPISSPDQSTQNFGRCPTVPHLWNRNLLNHDSINRTGCMHLRGRLKPRRHAEGVLAEPWLLKGIHWNSAIVRNLSAVLRALLRRVVVSGAFLRAEPIHDVGDMDAFVGHALAMPVEGEHRAGECVAQSPQRG